MRRVRRSTRSRWPALLALLAMPVAMLGAAGCGGDDDPAQDGPDAAQVLRDSAIAMSQLSTVAFELDIDGTVPGIGLRSARGELTSDGGVRGVGALITGESTAEIEFVILGETLYLQGPTGQFQELPASMAATVYDPSMILDADTGVPALLSGASDATVVATEKVNGVDAHRIDATLAGADLTVLLPGAVDDLPGQLWVAASDPKRLLRATVEVPLPDGESATVTLRFSAFDEPVEITPPN